MNVKLLSWLVCPRCGAPLRLDPPAPEGAEVEAADLVCPCGARYPVRDGVPDLLVVERGGDRRSRRSFGFQWRQFHTGDRTWFKDDLGSRKREFLTSMDATPAELAGADLLDAGCGNGELTRAVAEHGPQVVGLDFSDSVVGARRRLMTHAPALAPRVHYVQGDLRRLPLRDASFDLVHSSGVLHHTPSTAESFRRLARAVKPGGKLYVQLYRRRPAGIHHLNVALRALTTRLPLPLLYGLCYVATPLHAAASRWVHRLRGEPPPPRATARERALQMFDNYSPRYQHPHTVDEILRLFADEGFVDAREVTLENERRHMLAVLGRRPALPSAEPGR
jgi:SAM-dependent methyltransferase